ncbi:ABC transporter permease [Nocardioides sp. GY 10113]|uniref:ABC transporter permease n=1 Tax=Nocardioides sp. GY 10113 TaxID=2569761 RepID=UPI0010A936F5|nr:ABC transporter permease [Nocardioides sp. GY 10113]TIC87480.1 ABC transporter permease [Nocardioides sp. GY 10113]
MSTISPSFHLDVSGTTPTPFWRQVLVEFRKSYDTRAGFWLLAAIAGLVALVEGFVLVLTLVNGTSIAYSDYAIIAGGITSLLLPVLAILLVTTEWTQRSAMVTFSLEPRRTRVVLAKLTVSVLYVVATLVAMNAIALVATSLCELVQPEQTSWRFDVSGTVGFALVQVLTMAIGFALGALLLNTPAAIVVFFLYWYLLPIVLFAVGTIREWLGDLLEWVNFQAAVAPLGDWQLDTAEEWGKLLVSTALWIVLPLVAGMVRILRAEVK